MYVVRKIRSSLFESSTIVGILALASSAVIVSAFVLYVVLIKPTPVENPASFVRLKLPSLGGGLTNPVYKTIVRENDSFKDLIHYMDLSDYLVGNDKGSKVLSGASVSGNYFSTLGLDALEGRLIQIPDNKPSSNAVIVISESLWRGAFASDPSIVGNSIFLNGVPFVVIGVAPPTFSGLDNLSRQDFWIASEHIIDRWQIDSRSWPKFITWGRLKDGVSVEQAEQELEQLASVIRKEHPDDGPVIEFTLLSGMDARQLGSRGAVTKTVILVFSLIALLLLIATFNVGNLVSARVKSRSHEYVTFIAMGASRFWILRRICYENIILSGLGWGVGVLIAFVALKLYRVNLPGTGASLDLGYFVNAWVVFVFLIVPVLFGIFISLGGCLTVFRLDINSELRAGFRGSKQLIGRKLFVGLQVALSVVIVTVCGWFIESLRNAHAVDHGFESEKLILLSVNLKMLGQDYNNTYMSLPEFRRIKQRIEEIPEVEVVGMGDKMPLKHLTFGKVVVEGYDFRTEPDRCHRRLTFIGPDYFNALGIPLIEGRDVRFDDMHYPMSKVVVNEAFVQRFWPDQVALGRTFLPWVEGPEVEVIGVCSNFEQELGYEPEPHILVAFAKPDMVFHIKTSVSPELVRPTIQRILSREEPQLPIVEFITIQESFGDTFAAFKLSALIAGILAILALAIAGAGLFSLMFHIVKDYQHEIGIRMAIGANRSKIVFWTLRECGMPVVWGGVFGIATVLLFFNKISELLFNIDRFDVQFLFVVLGVLAVVSLSSMLGPAVHASLREPIKNLRKT